MKDTAPPEIVHTAVELGSTVMMAARPDVAVAVGVFTRPSALLMALYALGTALIGHPYWTMTGPEQLDAEINFYKNISIIGGLILLYVTGAGRYAVDAKFGLD